MGLLACPKCGSEMFMSTRSGARMVFQVNTEWQPVIVHPEQQPVDAVPINLQDMFCGACTWQGSVEMLVESNM
jgi:hypothetical protein